jgi:DNA segregation ATPase FtsK/SpoIIIE, S-DNA-T family
MEKQKASIQQAGDTEQTLVLLRDILESPEWKNTKAKLPIAVGKDENGDALILDLAEAHLLIGGNCGSGKTVCIHSIVTSLINRLDPDALRFLIIEPIAAAAQSYTSLPHLLTPVITNPNQASSALHWIIKEVDQRREIFTRAGVRNIGAYNELSKEQLATVESEGLDSDEVIPAKFCHLVIIIGELADLMVVAKRDVENYLARLAQICRSTGVHLIVASQRASNSVMTGVIRANIGARIAFQMATWRDSKVVLETKGAENLLGTGDLLYRSPTSSSEELVRGQGALVTDKEFRNIVRLASQQTRPADEVIPVAKLLATELPTDRDDKFKSIVSPPRKKRASSKNTRVPASNPEASATPEDVIEACVEIVRKEGRASVSLLQRRMRLGYTRASRVMDTLEEMGIVGPSRGAEPREILKPSESES